MQHTIERLEGLQVKVAVTLEPADLQAAFDEVFHSVKEQVQLPGFRKGKAPRKLVEAQIEKRFGRDWYTGNAIEKAVEKSLTGILKEAELTPYTVPHVHPHNLLEEYQEDAPLAYIAEFALRPEIPEFPYEGIQVRIPKRDIGEEDVELSLENIRIRLGEATPIEDRPAEPGDWASIRLRAWHPQTDFNRMPLFDNELDVQVGGGDRTIPFLDDHLIGLKPGEEIEADEVVPASFVQPPFPEDALLHLKITLARLEQRVLPELTDELIQEKLGVYETIEALREGIREQLAQHLQQSKRQDLQEAVQAHLLGSLTFEMPQIAVEQRYDDVRNQTLYQAKTEGQDLEAQWSADEALKERYETQFWEVAERSARLDFIADAVADRAKLEVGNDELANTVMDMARQSGLSQEDAQKLFQDRNFLIGVFTRIRRSKAWFLMLSQAEVEEVAVSQLAVEAAAAGGGTMAEALLQAAEESIEQLEALRGEGAADDAKG